MKDRINTTLHYLNTSDIEDSWHNDDYIYIADKTPLEQHAIFKKTRCRTKLNHHRPRHFSVNLPRGTIFPKQTLTQNRLKPKDLQPLVEVITDPHFTPNDTGIFELQFRKLLFKYRRDQEFFIINVLELFAHNKTLDLWQLQQLISNILVKIPHAAILSDNLDMTTFTNLVLYVTKLPIDWQKHHLLLTTIFDKAKMLLSNVYKRIVKPEFSGYINLLGNLSKLPYQKAYPQLPRALLHLFSIVFSFSQDIIYFVQSSKKNNLKQHEVLISTKELHLLWQYGVWQFGSSIYTHATYGELFSNIDYAVKAHFEALIEKQESGPWQTSNFESNIFSALQRILLPESAKNVQQQVVEGCYAIDIAFSELQIAIEVNGPHHYYGLEGRELRTNDVFRNELLRHLGWKVIIIPHFETHGLYHSKLDDYLRQKLQQDETIKPLLKIEQPKLYVPPHLRRQLRGSSADKDWRAKK